MRAAVAPLEVNGSRLRGALHILLLLLFSREFTLGASSDHSVIGLGGSTRIEDNDVRH